MKRIKEDVAYGIYDNPDRASEDNFLDLEDDPIVVQPQMSVQLSADKPPIEDDSYIPTSISALSHSAAEIARVVPEDQIKYFYRGLHRLLDSTMDQSDQEQYAKQDQWEDEMKESELKNKIKRVLLEMISPEDEEEFEEYRTGKPSAGSSIDYFGEEEPPSPPQSDEANLDDLAKEFGFSGPSGIRQFINRILNRMNFAASNLDQSALDSLTSFAVPEYISAMQEGDYIDPEDVEDLQANPHIVQGLPSYRYFFVSGFILPAYKQTTRENNRRVKSDIEALGLPKELHDTVFNQATGRAEEGMRTIRAKLAPKIESGEMTQDEARRLESEIRTLIQTSKESGLAGENFVDTALGKWQKLGRAKRLSILEKALQDTIDDSGV